jgi:hypothetical protein
MDQVQIQASPSAQSAGYNPPKYGYLRTFQAPIIEDDSDKEVLRQVIGRQGCYFIKITQDSGVAHIWHKADTSEIEIWTTTPDHRAATNAVHMIIARYIQVVAERAYAGKYFNEHVFNWCLGYMHQLNWNPVPDVFRYPYHIVRRYLS